MASNPQALAFLLLTCFLIVLDILNSLIQMSDSLSNNNMNQQNSLSNVPQSEIESDQSQSNEQPQKNPPDLLTPNHLKAYPLVNTTKSALGYVPLSKTMFSICNSSFQFARSYQPIKFVVGISDRYANRALEEMDRWLPSLQTVEVQDITTPITKPVTATIDSVLNRITTINGTVLKTIVEPTRGAIETVKEEFHSKVYDSDGKSIISSQADPVVAPFNNTLEHFVGNHFPDRKVPQEGHSSEISRTFKIMGSMIRGDKDKSKVAAK